MRFSGHETFYCRVNWLTKGLKYMGSNRATDVSKLFSDDKAMIELGVGKNMVSSIKYWMNVFGLISDGAATPFFNYLYNDGRITLDVDRVEILHLLNFQLCQSENATLYNYFFAIFIQSRPSGFFTANELFLSVKAYTLKSGRKPPSDKTLQSDVKVFLEMYSSFGTTHSAFEDNYSSILSPLGFLSETGRDFNDVYYRFNFTKADKSLSKVLIYVILKSFGYKSSEGLVLTASQVFDTVGVCFGFLKDEFYEMLSLLSLEEDKLSFEHTSNLGVQNLKIASQLRIETYNVLYEE